MVLDFMALACVCNRFFAHARDPLRVVHQRVQSPRQGVLRIISAGKQERHEHITYQKWVGDLRVVQQIGQVVVLRFGGLLLLLLDDGVDQPPHGLARRVEPSANTAYLGA